jgi:hypothetical protein
MKKQNLLPYAMLTILFFIVGFLTSLGLHWGIRPASAPLVSDNISTHLPDLENISYDVISDSNQILKATVNELEVTLADVDVRKSINEGRARALISELQTYRDDRDKLFQQLELRKKKLENKLEELDVKIAEKLSQRPEQHDNGSDYELANELTGLLSYPHPLNDQADLNAALIALPNTNAEAIQQRFELMLQIPNHDLTDDLYESLSTIINALNKTHENESRLHYIQCGQSHCEIQTSFVKVEPYFDYWQQWLDQLREKPATKLIQHDFYTETIVETDSELKTEINGKIIGTVIVAVPER